MTKDDMKLAVLIDGENIRSGYAKKLFDEIKLYGQAITRRVYVSPQFNKWENIVNKYDIEPVVISPAVRGKNAIDIALIGNRCNGYYVQRA